MCWILFFIYHGEVEVLADQLDTFLALANDLKVKGLSKESLTKKSLKMTNKCATPEEVDAIHSATDEEIKPQTNVKEEFQDIVGLKPSSPNIGGEETRNLYNCNWCAATSISVKGLEKHKYRKHSDEKQEARVVVSTKSMGEMFPCSLCDKLSVSKGGLQKHMMRHHQDV